MALTSRPPAPPLRRFVRRYYDFAERTGAPMRRVEGPGVDVLVILSFGPRWTIGSVGGSSGTAEARTSFVAGLHDRAVTTEHGGEAEGMQISFTPPGAYALFGLPLDELARSTFPLEDVFGAKALVPVARLADASGATERFGVLDEALLHRRTRVPDEGVVWAWRRLHRSGGTARIGALAEELGWSHKRLDLRFREQIGVSPKTLARTIRHERAARLVRQGTELARVATLCDFFDQAHLTNEFRRIAGTTPAAYAAATRDQNLQDAAAMAQ